MSILIKGMEMPRNCWECEFNKSTFDRMDFCTLTNKQYNWGLSERPSDCPLIEVPLHGRLIDADELLERFNVLQKQKDMYGREVSSCFEDSGSLCTEWWCVEEIVADAPTVIPADKDGET